MVTTVYHIDTIVSDPTVRGGQPIVTGTNIRISDIISSHLYRGQSPEELAANFALDLGQVYAVLAYYYQHKDEMDAHIRADNTEALRLLDELDHQGKLIRVE